MRVYNTCLMLYYNTLTLIRDVFAVDAGMASSHRILLVLVVLSLSLTCKARPAGLFLLKDAAEKGAVCLDGSPAGYYFRPGTGSGANKWMIYFRGGNWCFDLQSCFDRGMTARGSTKYWPKTLEFTGVLSDDKVVNPDFYNWNFIHVIYCDGMSFANFLPEPQFVGDIPVYFRGRVVLKAIIEELLELGVKDASEVLLIGTSAGAETVYLNADRVRKMIPQHIPMKAVADAGLFMDVPNRQGDWLFRNGVRHVFSNFNITAEGVDEDCANMFSDELWRCWFVPNFYNQIQTPIFIVNSPYDTVALAQILQLGCRPDRGTCDAESLLLANKWREDWLTAARDAINSPTNGMFVFSCFRHVLMRSTNPFVQITVRGRGVRDVVGDWYFGRRGNNTVIDCAFPCNPTC